MLYLALYKIHIHVFLLKSSAIKQMVLPKDARVQITLQSDMHVAAFPFRFTTCRSTTSFLFLKNYAKAALLLFGSQLERGAQ